MKSVCRIILLLFFINSFCSYASLRGLDGFEYGAIDAVKNARLHSSMGNIYFNEDNFKAALSEYEIAYNLASENSGASVYLYNIARCHFKLGNYAIAKKALEGAIFKDCMNMTYYEALADCIVILKEDKTELNKYLNDKENPYSRIVAGLILLKTGRKTEARTIFDEFVSKNPDMMITQDIKSLIKKIN